MDALLGVHMQVGLLNGKPKHDLRGILDRINRLAAKVRTQSGKVILIQHCGGKGDEFEPQGRSADGALCRTEAGTANFLATS